MVGMHFFRAFVLLVTLPATQLPARPDASSKVSLEPSRVTVSAGTFDRRQTVVSVKLPPGQDVWDLADDQKRRTPVQADGAGQGMFILDELAAGQSRTYRLVPAARTRMADPMQARREGAQLKLTIEGRPVLTYQAEPGDLPRPDIKPILKRGGFIHPLFTPGGLLVTDSYATNHLHQHGIWSAWTKTKFDGREPDFWNMAQGKATVEFISLDTSWSGVVHAGFRAQHRQVDLTSGKPIPAINESWELKLYRVGSGVRPIWVFDLTTSQQCASHIPLELPLYHYGGLGYRGHEQWNGAANTFFVTSDGITDRLKSNESRARWCDVGGMDHGKRAGTAILSHPVNFRAPQPMRTHSTEPFFCYAPSQLGDWSIKPGETYVSRYRFVVHDGAPDPEELDRIWNDFASPPTVKVE